MTDDFTQQRGTLYHHRALKYDRRHNILVMMNDLYRLCTLHLYIHALIYAAAVTIKQ